MTHRPVTGVVVSGGRRATVRARLLALGVALGVGLGLTAPAAAQVRPPNRPRPAMPMPQPQRPTPGRPSAARDTSKGDSSVVGRFSEPDSVMRALMARSGYTVTRYEASSVAFDATSRMLGIMADAAKRAIVQRDSSMVVADSGIFYSEKTKRVEATGSNIVVHDPTSGQADIVGRGRLEYSLAERSAKITNPRFSMQNGETWYIKTEVGKTVLGDSVRGKAPAFYGRGADLTSCDDSIPDYRFVAKEIKRSSGNTLVARPAILYIKDVPILWLPFIFQDTRGGRHSGILTPRFGISDIIRNSPNYRRNVEGLGYYWAGTDYMDGQLWLDWRSAAGGAAYDPGWTRVNGEWRYKWLDRFVSGNLASSYTMQRDGRTNLALNWGHQQDFSRNSHLTANINYVTSTQLQRQNTFNPYAVLATISSQLNYQQKFGPASLSLGATNKQYPGRPQVDRTFPTLSITTGALNLAPWLVWTPNFSYSASQTLNIDQPGPFQFLYTNGANGQRDSTTLKRSSRTASTSFDTPIRIFGYDLRNSFRVNETLNEFPEELAINDVVTGDVRERRVFARTYRTDVDWTPDFQLPPIFKQFANLTPSVSLSNVDPGPFWIRTPQSNGQFVHQSKRPSFSLSAAPTVFGLIPGIGPFQRFRHSVNPSISWSFAPKAELDTMYLKALNRSRAHELGGLRQNAISLGLSQNIEAKWRRKETTTGTTADSTGNPAGALAGPAQTMGTDAEGTKIKLLTVQFSSLQYDFERAKATHRALAGLTSQNWGYQLRSDLFPGLDLQVDYSLFQGSTLSDTAKFKPYRERVSASFQLGQGNNPFAIFARLFGLAVPQDERPSPSPDQNQVQPSQDLAMARQIANQPVAGSGTRGNRFLVPPSQGWSASLNFSSARQRPTSGNGSVIDFDPRARCQALATQSGNPLLLDACLAQQRTTPTTDSPIQSVFQSSTFYRVPPTTNIGGNMNFALTQKWTGTWQTTYDVERHEFASHIVSLQRDLHDWRAMFSFTQSPNGNFAFSFFISLKAEPDLKFDYNRATIRSGAGGFPSFP